MRQIKFRAWHTVNNVMMQNKDLSVLAKNIKDDNIWKFMQFTGFKDNKGVDVYEGDILLIKTPYRTTQTHTGDNIPNGSYTEPMEPAIKTQKLAVVFKSGVFGVYKEKQCDIPTPLSWVFIEWDLETLKEAVCWYKDEMDVFCDPDEGDLQYLLDEYNLKSEEELLKYISGFEIIGNIHENPELID